LFKFCKQIMQSLAISVWFWRLILIAAVVDYASRFT
jgi:hypothetical protein